MEQTKVVVADISSGTKKANEASYEIANAADDQLHRTETTAQLGEGICTLAKSMNTLTQTLQHNSDRLREDSETLQKKVSGFKV